MRVALIDDERLARNEMRRLLLAHPEMKVVGEAGSVMEAQALLADTEVDLIFLDVEMPGATGFDLLDFLSNDGLEMPRVILTTAFDQYAMRAFEVEATDCLLKPVSAPRLAQAISRLPHSLPYERLAGPLDRFYVRSGDEAWIVKTADIRLIESEGNYSRLLFNDARPVILRSLQALQERLDANFFRANRSQVVNLRWIKKVNLTVDGCVCATLIDGTEVSFSRRQSQLLKDTIAL